MMLRQWSLLLIVIGVMGVAWSVQPPSYAAPPTQTDEMINHGRYLAVVAGCYGCHTPYREEFADFSTLSYDELLMLSTREQEALDSERAFSGGRIFDLGPQGMVVSPNLTPDEETGLGAWADEEIKAAIQLGIHPDGRQLHPIMPFFTYRQMADADLDALVTFFRSLNPIENPVDDPAFVVPPFGMTVPDPPITIPDDMNGVERGNYLLDGVLPCTHCHTPLDPQTGAPLMDHYLAGGQPYEGPWGIVYAANITPHATTGLGEWNETDFYRAIASGVRPDGRRLILMVWQDYAALTPDDLTAVVRYLQEGLAPVEHEVPAPSLEDGFEVMVELGN